METKARLLSLWKDSRSWRQRFLQLLPSSVVFCCTLFLFAPLQIYLNNSAEFWFRLSTFALIPVAFFFASLMLCTLVGMLLRGKLFNLFVTSLLAAALVLYLQGNFLNISYGELTGTSINWSRYGGYAILNSCTVLFLFLLPFFIFFLFPALRKSITLFLSILIIGMQTAGIISLLVPYLNQNLDDRSVDFGWENVERFSKTSNLLLLILDATDGQDYQEYLLAHPEQEEIFYGFTYYRNTAGISTNTELSMPPLLTGYLNKWREATTSDYLQEAWSRETFFTVLKKNGFSIRFLAPPEYFNATARQIAENHAEQELLITDHIAFSKLLYRLVAYTYLPHVFKASFWIDPIEFNYLHESSCYSFDDASTYRHISMHPVRAEDSRGTFTLLHLYGMHPSFTLTSDAQRSSTPTSPLEQGEGVFLIVNTILDQLKSAGVYNNTSIIIAGDHANHRHMVGSSLTDPIFCPVLFYKPNNALHPYRVSDLPASLADICPTFLHDAYIDDMIQSELTGYPLSDLEQYPDRTRFFYRKDLTKTDQTLYEMIIPDGKAASEISNYVQTGKVFPHN